MFNTVQAKQQRAVFMVVLGLVLLVALLISGMAEGQTSEEAVEFPTRTIQIIVPWAAGGGTDVLARGLAPYLEKYLDESTTIVNRPGANGTIATSEFKNARADGHAVLFNAVGNFTIQPFLRDLNYELGDFKFVSGLTTDPILLGANADRGYESIDDLIEDYQESGEELSYAASAVGALPHLSQAALYQETGIDAAVVPHEGGGPAVTSVIGGHLDTVAAHPSEMGSQVEAGEMTALGVFSKERLDSYPDVPTVQEQGYDVGVFEVWKFVMVPADTPDEVVQILQDAFHQALEDPGFQEDAENLGLTPYTISGERVREDLADQQRDFQPVVESLGLEM